MTDPKVLDFSAPEAEAITVIFPDGETTCELPTADELTLPALQFLTSSGQEWSKLYEKTDLSAKERKRFGHLNQKLIEALLDVPQKAIASLSDKRKAAIILTFMSASPGLQQMMQQMVEADQATATSPSPSSTD